MLYRYAYFPCTVLASFHSTNATAALEIYIAQHSTDFVLASDSAAIELLKRAVSGVLNDVSVTPFQGFFPQGRDPIVAVLHREGGVTK